MYIWILSDGRVIVDYMGVDEVSNWRLNMTTEFGENKRLHSLFEMVDSLVRVAILKSDA